MAFSALFVRPFLPVDDTAGSRPVGAFLRRAGEALMEARRRQAECEVQRFIRRHGGELTDDLEREIGRRFGSPVS